MKQVNRKQQLKQQKKKAKHLKSKPYARQKRNAELKQQRGVIRSLRDPLVDVKLLSLISLLTKKI